ncbi:hypothetical protein [Desulfatibacillum aliphaticivorans]|uniref:hypothetical protein n=1 Tax=Desulfatibacillum aliphaticivorans TaxID=218208 RepID=UPI00042639B0|nr:hypothetical protein [Desulfatibacillum aliphaticivorans]
MNFSAFHEYLNGPAPVLFFRLDGQGRVLSMNNYACQICGDLTAGTPFQDILIDFQEVFDFQKIAHSRAKENLLSLQTVSGHPKSYLFVFKRLGNLVLAFGRPDIQELEMLRTEMVALNQELGNLTRDLHKKNAELQHALDHVKTLQGVIPICMHCHKIRNEKQVWDKLEEYLIEKADVDLSHSICPECMEKLYPEDGDDEC